MKDVEEGLCKLVIARGDGAADLQMADHTLDAVAVEIDVAVPTDRGLAVRARRDDGPDSLRDQGLADRAAVVPLVGEKMIGSLVGQRHHIVECRAVRRFAAGEIEGKREPGGINEKMNFTGEPAPRPAKSLFVSPPFAPAADTWPRTVVLSMLWRELSAIAWARVVATASQMPAALHRRKRWYTVIHLPYFSGTSRQGAPVRMRQRMPFTMGRLSKAGRLLRPRSGGNRPANNRHSSSVKSPRLNNPSLQEESLNQGSIHPPTNL